jgi:hypothetical protein
MAKSVKVTLEWADGEYLFALRSGEIEELESISHNPETDKKGIGVGAVWMRLMGGGWYVSDIFNVIRLGLIGGGLDEVKAKRLVDFYAKNKPLSDVQYTSRSTPTNPLTVAQAILAAAIVGVNEEDTEPDSGEPQTPQP